MQDELCVVTGAFGYTGRYVAERFLDLGARVRTLTGSPERESPFGTRLDSQPFNI
jgi:NAD(P)-dependent dehydrogenase (short-subunit alcohol dehydrogenase family)